MLNPYITMVTCRACRFVRAGGEHAKRDRSDPNPSNRAQKRQRGSGSGSGSGTGAAVGDVGSGSGGSGQAPHEQSGGGALTRDVVRLQPVTNNAGGTLGGITSGADLVFRVAIKPVSTIGKSQATATFTGEPAVLEAKGRHDSCVLPRAPPLVEGMACLVLADAAMAQHARVGAALSAALPGKASP